MAVKFESPWVLRPCPICGELATNHAWYYDEEAPLSGPDHRRPVSEVFEHADKEPCPRFNTASSQGRDDEQPAAGARFETRGSRGERLSPN